MVGCSRHPECDLDKSTGTPRVQGSTGICCRKAMTVSLLSRLRHASTTSAGTAKCRELGIGKPKHDLDWPPLRPLFWDNDNHQFKEVSCATLKLHSTHFVGFVKNVAVL